MAFAEADDKAARLWQSLASGELADLPGIAERRATIDRAVDYDARFAQALHGRPVVLGFFFKPRLGDGEPAMRSEEHTSEIQSLMRISYAVFCLQKKHTQQKITKLLQHTSTF